MTKERKEIYAKTEIESMEIEREFSRKIEYVLEHNTCPNIHSELCDQCFFPFL